MAPGACPLGGGASLRLLWLFEAHVPGLLPIQLRQSSIGVLYPLLSLLLLPSSPHLQVAPSG